MQMSNSQSEGLGFLALHGASAVDRLVERQHRAYARGLGLRDQIRLGEVQTVHLVNLERSQQRRAIDGLDRRHRDGR